MLKFYQVITTGFRSSFVIRTNGQLLRTTMSGVKPGVHGQREERRQEREWCLYNFFSTCGGQQAGRRQARLQCERRLSGREVEETRAWVERVPLLSRKP